MAGMEDTMLGKLAKEILEDVDIDKLQKSIGDNGDILKAIGDPNSGFSDLISNVSRKMATKISSGELKQESLLQDAMKFASVMPGMFGNQGTGGAAGGTGGAAGGSGTPDMASMMKMMGAMMNNKEGMEAFGNMMNPKGKKKDTRTTFNKNAYRKSVAINRLKTKLDRKTKKVNKNNIDIRIRIIIMFWLDNLKELFNPILYPNVNMTIDEKINAIIRLILFTGIIATLIFNDSRYILFIFIIMLISILIYNYQMDKNKMIEKYLNENDLDIINNEKCVKPTQDNPFMNPSLIGYNNKYDSCSIENQKIKENIDYYFNSNVFRETDDLYDKSLLDRQFYTVPSTTIPNNREKLTSWLYERGPSCKENNGEQCYNNLYNNVKNTAHF